MKTPIPYYGGKQSLLRHILPLIPGHKLYTETFCGGAAVLFAKRPVDAEVINDINMELVNFYLVAKGSSRNLLIQEVEKTLHSRAMHAHANHILQYPQFFNPVQRAWAVWMSCNTSFASKMNDAFGYDLCGQQTRALRNAKANFTEGLCSRLDNVTIENRDALDVISTYDSPDAFHFVDPPYINSVCGPYKGTFDEQCMEKLLQLLERVKGKFMLTMFPRPMIEEYANKNGWIIHRVERTVCAANKIRRKQEEWMVCNYDEHPQRNLFDIQDSSKNLTL